VLDTIRRTLGPSSYIDVGSFAQRSMPATERYATLRQRAALHQWGRRFGCHTCGSRGWRRTGLQHFQRRLSSLRRWKMSSQPTHLFVGDHQPPKSIAAAAVQEAMRLPKVGPSGGGGGGVVARWLQRTKLVGSKKAVSPTAFRFYPQCVTCSNRQGSLLSAVSQQRKSTVVSLVPSIPLTRRFKSNRSASYFYNHGWRPRKFHLTGSVVAVWTTMTTTTTTADVPHKGGTARKASPHQWRPPPLGGTIPNLGKFSEWMRPRPNRHPHR
jgi:hypothetical protein